jgi:hypothetical protein
MGTFISMNASLTLPDIEPVRKILCDTVLSYWCGEKAQVMQAVGATTDAELIKKASIEKILEKDFEIENITEDDDTNTYEISFNSDCGYGWSDELRRMFTSLAEHLSDGSNMTMESDDDGGWYESYEIKDGKLISGESHDFFTDDGGCPSDDEIADAIIKAAGILVANPSARTGLAEAFSNVSSVQDIVDTLPS